MIAGRRYTSVAAIQRFVAMLNPPLKSPRNESRIVPCDQIDLALDAAGF